MKKRIMTLAAALVAACGGETAPDLQQVECGAGEIKIDQGMACQECAEGKEPNKDQSACVDVCPSGQMRDQETWTCVISCQPPKEVFGDKCLDACPSGLRDGNGNCYAAPDAGTPDAGQPDSGVTPDAGSPDSGTTPDAGVETDSGTPDSGNPVDSGTETDAGTPVDSGVPCNGSCGQGTVCNAQTNTCVVPDAGTTPDAGTPDSGSGTPDAGTQPAMCNVEITVGTPGNVDVNQLELQYEVVGPHNLHQEFIGSWWDGSLVNVDWDHSVSYLNGVYTKTWGAPGDQVQILVPCDYHAIRYMVTYIHLDGSANFLAAEGWTSPPNRVPNPGLTEVRATTSVKVNGVYMMPIRMLPVTFCADRSSTDAQTCSPRRWTSELMVCRMNGTGNPVGYCPTYWDDREITE